MTVWIIKNEEDRKRFIRMATLESINTLPEELQLPLPKEANTVLKKGGTYDAFS